MHLSDLTLQQKKYLIGSIGGSILLFFLLGCVFFPSIFYDHFIWKYFWGPIVQDALDKPVSYHGVVPAAKFTWISELVYGALILIVVYGLYKLFQRWKITIDFTFFIAVFPYILYGSIARVLEDSHLFTPPVVFWFVTPLIYFQTVFWAFLFIVLGYVLQKHMKQSWITIKSVFFVGGVLLCIPMIYHTIQWFIGNRWSSTAGVRFDIFFVIFGILLGIMFLVYLISSLLKKYPQIKVLRDPFNLSMIFGQMLDGLTTYITIYDPFHMGLPPYVEKHPASDFIMQIWPPLFPIVKFALVLTVIYVFDITYKEELKEHRQLVNLFKIGIFLLGFAPGFRDLLRVMMGV